MANYVLEGPRWGTGALGTGGGTVTWAVDSTVSAGFTSQIGAAFADWTSRANIAFKQQASTSGAQITFGLTPIDGLNKVLGTTNYTYSGQKMVSAAVTFDSGEGWHASGNQIVSNDAVNFFLVAVHEIGHALGLDHYNAGQAVMNSIIDRSVTDLTSSDVAGIQALYGAPATTSATVVPTVSATPTAFGTIQYNGLGHRRRGLRALQGPPRPRAGRPRPRILRRRPRQRRPARRGRRLDPGLRRVRHEERVAAQRCGLRVEPLHQRAQPGAGRAGPVLLPERARRRVNRATVAAQIATSNEAQTLLQSTFTAGVAVPDAANAQVARLFYGVLGRAPDSKGLAYFSSIEKSAGAAGIAQMMLSSPEFVNSHGTLSDAGYVDSLFMGALGRHADASALSYWGGQVSGLGRAQVAAQIAQSPRRRCTSSA